MTSQVWPLLRQHCNHCYHSFCGLSPSCRCTIQILTRRDTTLVTMNHLFPSCCLTAVESTGLTKKVMWQETCSCAPKRKVSKHLKLASKPLKHTCLCISPYLTSTLLDVMLMPNFCFCETQAEKVCLWDWVALGGGQIVRQVGIR